MMANRGKLMWNDARFGIHTIGDLARCTPGMLNRIVGKKFAVQLHENANGRDDSPVDTETREAKSISAERTFSNDIGTEKDIDRELFNVACIVAHRLRRAGFSTSCVSVFLKYRSLCISASSKPMLISIFFLY